MGAVCGIALSLRHSYVQAPEGVRDCVRCAAKRALSGTRGEKIGQKVRRSLFDPGRARM